MRRNNFLIGALVALATFITLSAFVGRRPLGWHRGWHHGRYYDSNRDRYYDRNDNNRLWPERKPLTDSTSIQ